MSTSKGKPRDPERVQHMVTAANLTIASLLTDKTMQLALERQLGILGEAASRVSVTTQEQWGSIDWRRIKNFRNLIAHEYFRVDYAELLHVAQQIIPSPLPFLADLLTELDQQFGPDARV